MQRIASGIAGHHSMRDVGVHDLSDHEINWNDSDLTEQIQHFGLLRLLGLHQFFHHGRTGDQIVLVAVLIPPLARPVLSSEVFGRGPFREVETRDGRFDIDSFHGAA